MSCHSTARWCSQDANGGREDILHLEEHSLLDTQENYKCDHTTVSYPTLGSLSMDSTKVSIEYLHKNSRGSKTMWDSAFADLSQFHSLRHLCLHLNFRQNSDVIKLSTVPDFVKLVLGLGESFVSFCLKGSGPRVTIEAIIDSLRAKPRLEAMKFSIHFVDFSEPLAAMFETGIFSQLRSVKLWLVSSMDVSVERWMLPRLESLSLDCGSCQTALRLEHFTTLTLLNCSIDEGTVYFGDACSLRILRLVGNAAAVGDISAVLYLGLIRNCHAKRIVEMCPNVTELSLRGRGPADCFESLSLPYCLCYLELEHISLGELSIRSQDSLQTLILNNVAIGLVPQNLGAKEFYLQGESPMFFQPFAEDTRLLGSPRCLSLICGGHFPNGYFGRRRKSLGDQEAAYQADVLSSIVKLFKRIMSASSVRAQLQAFVTNIPLRATFKDVPRLRYLGLLSGWDVQFVVDAIERSSQTLEELLIVDPELDFEKFVTQVKPYLSIVSRKVTVRTWMPCKNVGACEINVETELAADFGRRYFDTKSLLEQFEVY